LIIFPKHLIISKSKIIRF